MLLSVEVKAVVPRAVDSSLILGMMVRRAACKKAKKCGLDATMFT